RPRLPPARLCPPPQRAARHQAVPPAAAPGRPTRAILMLGYWLQLWRRLPALALTAQRATRRLFDRRDELGGKGLDLGVGQGRILRLQRHGDRQRFLAFGQPLALVEVEQADVGDELSVDAAGSPQQCFGRHALVDDKGEITLDRLEHRELEQRPGTAAAR